MVNCERKVESKELLLTFLVLARVNWVGCGYVILCATSLYGYMQGC
jgi:hypothetical protein